jgi:ribosomal protein S18 acetylase RimI-like enzyme
MRTVTGHPGSVPATLSADDAAGPPPANTIMPLKPDEWKTLKGLRLAALKDSPDQFLARYDVEKTYEEARWRDELIRDEWFVCRMADGTEVAILRIDEVPDVGRRHLGYMWVSPDYRGCGLGRKLVIAALHHLADDPVRKYAYLYVLTGNVRARGLYEDLGFRSIGPPALLPDGSGRYEQLMQVRLAEGAVGGPARTGPDLAIADVSGRSSRR